MSDDAFPINESSLAGVWCDYSNLAPHGYMAMDELTLQPDHSFTWRTVEFEDPSGSKPNFQFVAVEGQWQLNDGQLELAIESSTHEYSDFDWVRFEVSMRAADDRRHPDARQLVLSSSLCRNGEKQIDADVNLFPFESAAGAAEANHAQINEKLSQRVVVDGPYKKLIPVLSKAVVLAASRMEVAEPLFCMRLYFYDTHAPADDYGVVVRCVAERLREQVIADDDPIEAPDSLWHPTLGVASEEGDGVYELDLTSTPKVQQIFQEIYESIADSEEENMPKLRAALRKTAAKLNKATWPDNIQLTDDFVVFPADGSDFFGGEYLADLEESLPKKTVTLLKKRGYLSE